MVAHRVLRGRAIAINQRGRDGPVVRDVVQPALRGEALTGGAILALTNADPVALILITQYAAGLSPPVLAIFLIVVMNRREMLGDYVNGVWSNILGIIVVLGVCALGALPVFGVV